MTENRVVILTALNREYTAVRRRLNDPRVYRHERGTRFELGSLSGTNCQIALGLADKGNHPAAVLAERAIQQFSPAAVLFVGVAGALRDTTPLGDVVMATHVYAYHGGTSEDDGLKARPRVWEAPHEIVQIAAHLARTEEWREEKSADAGEPTVHFGAIAAGEVVQNSSISGEARWIRDHYNDALAIEMEAAGVAQAGHLNSSRVAVVRGISDRADGTKTSSEDSTWQPRAAANAAAFACKLAEELSTEQEHAEMNQHSEPQRGTVVHNSAHRSQVGIQAAHVTNSTVRMNTGPQESGTTDLAEELAAFRDHLRQERSSGNIDKGTYEAVQSELEIAGKALESEQREDRGTVVLALKKVSGLIGDVTSLATRIATLITAANGLS
ncbi:purine phosphorylase [Actinopolyspora erythraea]|uniref:Purine phosphorylase n=1 Tax=Actinopolyspora erythraea TaxID=414996 RepID=A0A099D5L9_9ACTN|nr:5'-methylthioadenosine/S-adenosylhomocysteine nucleosidase [Actinopolyspora erythraea]ASU78884.1 purine phosphorylase [Actinopolyspora erythraea]KGI81236.1 purine phosphorylase [Actinopolyspora erythraea]